MSIPLPLQNKISRDNAKKTIEESVLKANFGNNYTQIAPNGLNALKESWSIEWAGLTLAEKISLEATLDTLGAWGIVYWIPLYDVKLKEFRIKENSRSFSSQNNNVFSVGLTLEQCFLQSYVPIYSLTTDKLAILAGQILNIYISTLHVPNGTILYLTLSGTNVVSGDFTNLTAMYAGSTISDNKFNFALQLANSFTVAGNLQMVLQLRTGSSSGTIVATSKPINLIQSH